MLDINKISLHHSVSATNRERIEKINASIREYKKNLSDAKKELKDFNKTYKEQSKKLQQDLKSINREDFVSEETERLRHKLEKLEFSHKVSQKIFTSKSAQKLFLNFPMLGRRGLIRNLPVRFGILAFHHIILS